MATLLELTAHPGAVGLNIQEILGKIAEEYRDASTQEQRERLLGLHFSCLDIVESQIVDAAALAEMRDARRRHYYALLVSEVPTTDGLIDDPADLRRITDREVAAGRMAEDDGLRYLALHGSPRPPGQPLQAASTSPIPPTTRRPGLRAWLTSLFRQ